MSIGAVLDLSSQMGKHQKIAMQIALQEFNRSSCSKLDLKIKNSQGNSAQTVASGNVNGNSVQTLFIHTYWLIKVAFIYLYLPRLCLKLVQKNPYLIFFFFFVNGHSCPKSVK